MGANRTQCSSRAYGVEGTPVQCKNDAYIENNIQLAYLPSTQDTVQSMCKSGIVQVMCTSHAKGGDIRLPDEFQARKHAKGGPAVMPCMHANGGSHLVTSAQAAPRRKCNLQVHCR